MNIKEHYENLLGKYYSWIFGGFDLKKEENLEFFRQNEIYPKSSKVALDLGAGSGFQSIPLAELGFSVKSIDISPTLLSELKQHSGDLDIETIQADILDFDSYPDIDAELIICMGDTLTHLPELQSVRDLIQHIHKILSHHGKFIVTLRDLSYELENEERFIPTRSTNDQISTCFLEYFDDYVKVFDIIQTKINDNWEQSVSWYKKIIIPETTIKKHIKDAGFSIEFMDKTNELITIIAKKH